MRRRLSASRASARRAIDEGRVVVAGIPEPKAATLVAPDTPVRIDDGGHEFVSRGGVKLAHALDEFGIDPTGRDCLDAGASTGGFTDCLLRRGAARVVAVDVGYGQLDWSLRNDPRVVVRERVNIRHGLPGDPAGPFDVIVADLSFISLRTVLPALVQLGDTGTDYVLLVKPQFEVGKGKVGRGGIVRSPELHAETLTGIAAACLAHGLGVAGVTVSPIEGAKGNREFLLWARPDVAGDGTDAIAGAVAS